MSFVIKDMSTVPPGGWDYVQRITSNGVEQEYKLVDFNLAGLERKVRRFRVSNGLTSGQDVRSEILEDICCRRPELCRDTDEQRPVGKIASFMRAMLEWKNLGFATVPDEVMQARQDTCLGCEHWRGWKKVGLGICSKCGCPCGRASLKLYLPEQTCPVGKWGKWKA